MSDQPPYGYPPAGYQGGGYPPPPSRPRIRFEAIGEAWGLFQRDAATWIISVIIYFAIIFVAGAIIGVATGVTGEVVSRTGGPGGISAIAMPAFSLVQILARIVIFILSTFLLSGMYRMAIKSLRNEQINVADMFSVGDVLPACLLAALIVGLLTGIGFMRD
jgi:ABC-type dipeptide/oligopeptide/nickel transport system permease component